MNQWWPGPPLRATTPGRRPDPSGWPRLRRPKKPALLAGEEACERSDRPTRDTPPTSGLAEATRPPRTAGFGGGGAPTILTLRGGRVPPPCTRPHRSRSNAGGFDTRNRRARAVMVLHLGGLGQAGRAVWNRSAAAFRHSLGCSARGVCQVSVHYSFRTRHSSATVAQRGLSIPVGAIPVFA